MTFASGKMVRLSAVFTRAGKLSSVGDPVMFCVRRGKSGATKRGEFNLPATQVRPGVYELEIASGDPGVYRYAAKSPSGLVSPERGFRVFAGSLGDE